MSAKPKKQFLEVPLLQNLFPGFFYRQTNDRPSQYHHFGRQVQGKPSAHKQHQDRQKPGHTGEEQAYVKINRVVFHDDMVLTGRLDGNRPESNVRQVDRDSFPSTQASQWGK